MPVRSARSFRSQPRATRSSLIVRPSAAQTLGPPGISSLGLPV
jgi:hypothetical protein